MALSTQHKLEDILGIIRVLADQLDPAKVQNPALISIIHKAVLSVYGALGDAVDDDYVTAVAVSTLALANYSSVVTATSYDNSTKIVTKSGHGLAVGDSLVVWDEGGKITIVNVTSVPGSTTFVISTAIGATVTNFKYVKFTPSVGLTIDISSLAIDHIIKISDSTTGLCVERPFNNLDNCEDNPLDRQNIHWNRKGNYLYLHVGSTITPGTLTLYYKRIPNKITTTTDYMDIRDQYIPEVIDSAKLGVYEILSKRPPEQLVNSVQSRLESFRQKQKEELAQIKAGQK